MKIILERWNYVTYIFYREKLHLDNCFAGVCWRTTANSEHISMIFSLEGPGRDGKGEVRFLDLAQNFPEKTNKHKRGD